MERQKPNPLLDRTRFLFSNPEETRPTMNLWGVSASRYSFFTSPIRPETMPRQMLMVRFSQLISIHLSHVVTHPANIHTTGTPGQCGLLRTDPPMTACGVGYSPGIDSPRCAGWTGCASSFASCLLHVAEHFRVRFLESSEQPSCRLCHSRLPHHLIVVCPDCGFGKQPCSEASPIGADDASVAQAWFRVDCVHIGADRNGLPVTK